MAETDIETPPPGRQRGQAPPARRAAPRAAAVVDDESYDAHDDDAAQARASTPTDDPEAIFDEAIVEDADVEVTLPRIPSARVLYLGGNPKKSVSLVGQMILETWQDEDGTERRDLTPSLEGGCACYDFASRDNRGRIIELHIMPRTSSPRMRGKPFARVEHPEHLRHFLRAKGRDKRREFEVVVPDPQARERFRRYVMDKDRQQGRRNALADYAQGLRETPE